MYTGQTMYTLPRRSPQQKHHFAYTEACAYWRGAVYASAQKASAKTSFCVYRSWGVCEGQCVRICAESSQRKHDFAYTNTGASARGDVYAFMQKASAKASFCVYRSRRVCEGRCIRFCLGALSESMYTGKTMYTHLRRKLQQKHHFAYTEAGASARGAVYASA